MFLNVLFRNGEFSLFGQSCRFHFSGLMQIWQVDLVDRNLPASAPPRFKNINHTFI